MVRLIRNLFPFLLLMLNATVFADELDWHKPLCEKLCGPETELEKSIPSEIISLGTLIREGEAIDTSIKNQIDHWGDFVRWLKKDKTKKPPTNEFPERWKKLQDEARALIEVQQAIGVTNRRIDVCINNCSAARKLELLDELEILEKIKVHLVALSPWWISEEFSEMAEIANADYNYRPTSEALKKVFVSSMSNYFNEAFNIRSDISVMKAKIDHSLKRKSKNPRGRSLITDFSLNHSSTLDLILKRGIGNANANLCSIANYKAKWDKAKFYSAKALKGSLSAASLLAGPEGFLALSVGARAIPFLAKIGFTTSRTVAFLPSAGLAAKLLQERIDLGKKCDSKISTVTQDAWQKCIRERERASLSVLFTTATTISGPVLPHVMKLIKKN